MKIRTLDDLSSSLSSQLAWRKKEFSEIKYMVETTAIPKHKKNVLIRSAITMIYAHWEGYLKLAGRYYLEYIASQRLKNSELCKNLLLISLGSSSGLLKDSKKYSSYSSVVDFFDTSLGNRAIIPFKTVIDTESNLSSSVLKEIVWCLNLSYRPFEIKQKVIDEKMLARRNFIAHGEFLEVDEKDVIALRDDILELLIDFKNQIENAALTKAYMH
jgi:hypothetical protein